MDIFSSEAPDAQDHPEPDFKPDQPHRDSWQYWAPRITATWQASVGNIVETGKQLIEAKKAVPPGEFGDMIKKFLPFGSRTAQKLMRLAKNKVLTHTTHEFASSVLLDTRCIGLARSVRRRA